MKKIFIVAVLSLLTVTAFSQSNFTSLQYSVGFGTGNMHDYISAVSWRGFTFDYRNYVKSNIGVGFELGWNVFYEEKPDAVYDYENITYSGKQWRYSNHWPALLAADYFMETGGGVTPYVGLGLGTMYTLQNTDMGTYSFEKDAWHFAIRPELGILIQPTPGMGINLVSKYYYGLKAGDLPAQGYVTINVGFVFVN
jgi:opacity protein-like surface antigen